MSTPRDEVIVFSGAGSKDINVQSQFVRILEATGYVYLSFDGSTQEMKRRVGQEVNYGQKFKRLLVRTESAQTVRIVVADFSQPDDLGDSAVAQSTLVTNDESSPIPTEEQTADDATALEDVVLIAGATAVNIASANPLRVGVLITVPLDLPAGIRIGVDASATKGARMTAGDSIIIGAKNAIKAFSETANGTAQTVNATEITRT